MGITSPGFSVDWGNCARKLKQLKRESVDAADNAETANSRKDDLDSAQGLLEQHTHSGLSYTETVPS